MNTLISIALENIENVYEKKICEIYSFQMLFA